MEIQKLTVLPNHLNDLFNDLLNDQENSADRHEPILDKDSDPSSTHSTSYYRSRLFTASAGVNLLITAAQPLLATFSRLQDCTHYDNTDNKYHTTLIHELNAFSTRTLGFGYSQSTLQLARYLLCTAIDDVSEQLMAKLTQEKNHALEEISPEKNTVKNNADFKLQKESNNEHFFTLINQLQKNTKQNIDLLEFAYLIISLGYTGAYRFHAIGKLEIENILERLYTIIREQRGDKLPKLLQDRSIEVTSQTVQTSNRILSWVALVAFSSLTLALFAFGYTLNKKSQPIVAKFQSEFQTKTFTQS